MEDTKSARKGTGGNAPVSTVEQARQLLSQLEGAEREHHRMLDSLTPPPEGSFAPREMAADRAEDDVINYIEGWGYERAPGQLRLLEGDALYGGHRPPGREDIKRMWTFRHMIELIEEVAACNMMEADQIARKGNGGRRRRGTIDPRQDAEEALIQFMEGDGYIKFYDDLCLVERLVVYGTTEGDYQHEVIAAALLYRGLLDRVLKLALCRQFNHIAA